jgi:PAS domain S-box-containing protein
MHPSDHETFLDRTGRLAGVGGWEVDLVARTLYWSDQTCRIHDLQPGHRPTLDEALGYYAPEVRASVQAAMGRAIAQGAPFDIELPLNTARGRRIWVRAVGEVGFEGGRAVRIFGAVQDVTRRHEAETALRELYERTPAMMHSIDREGRLLTVSDRWLDKMGYTRDEVIGLPAIDFFTLASRQLRVPQLQQLWATGRHRSGLLQVRTRNGSLLDLVVSAIVQQDASPVRALVVSDDVTELRARTAQLHQEQEQREQLERQAAELNALLDERSEMLDVLAHEVRQPLNNASAALQSAAAALVDPGSRTDAAARLQRAQGVMHAVMAGVDNTLAAATLLGRGALPATLDAEADVDTLLAVVIADMPGADRARVRIERATATRTAAMDIGLTRLALRNLLANALRHSPPEAPVVLRVIDSDQPLALVLDVIDRGPGIAPGLQPRLFERGVRGRDRSGRASHGLGLYIVRRALELQGGRAELAHSGPDGTTMRLWLAQAAVEASDSGARNT